MAVNIDECGPATFILHQERKLRCRCCGCSCQSGLASGHVAIYIHVQAEVDIATTASGITGYHTVQWRFGNLPQFTPAGDLEEGSQRRNPGIKKCA